MNFELFEFELFFTVNNWIWIIFCQICNELFIGNNEIQIIQNSNKFIFDILIYMEFEGVDSGSQFEIDV